MTEGQPCANAKVLAGRLMCPCHGLQEPKRKRVLTPEQYKAKLASNEYHRQRKAAEKKRRQRRMASWTDGNADRYRRLWPEETVKDVDR